MPVLIREKFFPLLLSLIAFACGICVLYFWYEDLDIAVADAFINALTFTLCIVGGASITKKYPTHVAAIIYSIFIGASAGFVSHNVASLLLQWWYDDSPSFHDLYNASCFARLLLHMVCACWIISLTAMKKRNDDLEEKMTHIADAVTLRKEAELFKLRQQLQPHFLYNSLNSINALILTLPDKAQEMVGKLSDFLRASVKRDAQTNIPLTEELQYIETYLAIESVRFGDRLNVVFEKDFTADMVIPPFILQPILENAIKFGVYGTTGTVTISIRISQEDDMLQIRIENPYTDVSRPATGTGFGLEGIARRLFLLHGRSDLLSTETDGDRFITILKLPQL